MQKYVKAMGPLDRFDDVAERQAVQLSTEADGSTTYGLASLVRHFLGKTLDKQWQCSDWQRRPLLAEQK